VFPAAIEDKNLSTQPKDQTIFVVDDESVIPQNVGLILRNAETRAGGVRPLDIAFNGGSATNQVS